MNQNNNTTTLTLLLLLVTTVWELSCCYFDSINYLLHHCIARTVFQKNMWSRFYRASAYWYW